MGRIRVQIQVCGVVQGVGFRPFIHKQVAAYSLAGWICNTSSGVEMELEGEEAAISRFLQDLQEHPPRLAVIESVSVTRCPELKHERAFVIRESKTMRKRNTLISPDVATCDDCLRELFDPKDRRYRYPFINCTNCGPRFTIIRDIPYDRCQTTMRSFPMCPDCDAEYHEISTRRYHAQPDCCPVCGPQLTLYDENGQVMDGDPMEMAVKSLWDGEILAVKGLGGIHLACRCDDPDIAYTLRRRKHRDEKPFAIMCRDVETARRFCEISPDEEHILSGVRRPIVLLKKRERSALAHISENDRIGIMLPYTPVHHLLLHDGPDCLIMTSANLSDWPIVSQNEEAFQTLHGIADKFLLHNREIHTRCDDSLCWVVDGKEYPARRSRGYAPFPVSMRGCTTSILACGAEQKATFSLSREEHVFQSQHIGDLKNIETYENYTAQIRHFSRMFDITPQMLACDLHPDYLSTAYAQERAERENLPLLQVQHHWAHMASCMADNGLETPTIGVIWDGTGYGTDGTIWGGEILTGDYSDFQRWASIRPIRLPGGDRAIGEIWRIGVSLLRDAEIDPIGFFSPEQIRLTDAVLSLAVNCPVSSGMGRLFDGVSAILSIKEAVSYEGQGAVLLEAAATQASDSYPYAIGEQDGLFVFDYRPMLRALCADLVQGRQVGEIAAAFMNTLVNMAAELCCRIRTESGLEQVVLSGGTFQNMYLLHRLTSLLRENGFSVYHHSRVSTNDEGISFGQMAIAAKGGRLHVPCNSPENNGN